MEVISIIVMFMFGNMNDQATQMSSCMKEVRLLKKKSTGYDKDAFCGPAIVEIKDNKVIKLYNEIPEGAVLVKKQVTKEAFREWSLEAKKKWEKD